MYKSRTIFWTDFKVKKGQLINTGKYGSFTRLKAAANLHCQRILANAISFVTSLLFVVFIERSILARHAIFSFDHNSRTWSQLNAASQDYGNVQYCFELKWN